jgi:hypothetical protein
MLEGFETAIFPTGVEEGEILLVDNRFLGVVPRALENQQRAIFRF